MISAVVHTTSLLALSREYWCTGTFHRTQANLTAQYTRNQDFWRAGYSAIKESLDTYLGRSSWAFHAVCHQQHSQKQEGWEEYVRSLITGKRRGRSRKFKNTDELYSTRKSLQAVRCEALAVFSLEACLRQDYKLPASPLILYFSRAKWGTELWHHLTVRIAIFLGAWHVSCLPVHTPGLAEWRKGTK